MTKQSLSEKIQSISSSIGSVYRKPSIEIMKMLVADLWFKEEFSHALDYLRKERAFTDDTIKHFNLGYDLGKDAISIPIFKNGELVNIKYRYLDPSRHNNVKYTQEKDCEVWLYNDEAIQIGMKKGGILIVEGEFDCMSCWQAGIENVVSPASGKDSYGIWLELLDNIPNVYISYDNDNAGKKSALVMSERIGMEKCQEVRYPEDVKDANEFFKKYDIDDYKELLKNARPFYSHKFKGVRDIIEDLRFNKADTLKIDCLPDVKIGQDWLMVISGRSNVGKTSYVMNIANQFIEKDIPVLVMPFERGNQVVGTRFLQIKYNLAEGDFATLEDSEWDKMTQECLDTPLYFSLPARDEAYEIIKKAKRIFNTKVVIIDHLDYMVRNSQHKEQEIGTTLQELKRLAEENKIVMIVVTHIRKIDSAGSKFKKKPAIEDLKGSASLYQDPECVVMLTSDSDDTINVDIVKNKGKMSNKTFKFSRDSGRLGDETSRPQSHEDEVDEEFNNF